MELERPCHLVSAGVGNVPHWGAVKVAVASDESYYLLRVMNGSRNRAAAVEENRKMGMCE